MMNCYLYTGEAKYLDYAKTAMDYILTNWTKTNVSGIFGGIYTRYSDSAGGAIDIMSVGRAVMVFAQLYQLTGEAKYLSAAKAQGKILLKAQETPYPELEGHHAAKDKVCLCTSTPKVQKYLMDSVEYICRQAPKIGGFFTITRSENPTNCYSHSKQDTCHIIQYHPVYTLLHLT